MDDDTLVDDDKYEGKYVAFASFDDRTVVAFGDDPMEVHQTARNAGYEDPVLVYIHCHDIVYTY